MNGKRFVAVCCVPFPLLLLLLLLSLWLSSSLSNFEFYSSEILFWFALTLIGPSAVDVYPTDAYMRQETSQRWFRQWLFAWSAPSHYLNQCWNIVDWNLRNKFRWNPIQTPFIFIQKIHLKLSFGRWRPFVPASVFLKQGVHVCKLWVAVKLWQYGFTVDMGYCNSMDMRNAFFILDACLSGDPYKQVELLHWNNKFQTDVQFISFQTRKYIISEFELNLFEINFRYWSRQKAIQCIHPLCHENVP